MVSSNIKVRYAAEPNWDEWSSIAEFSTPTTQRLLTYKTRWRFRSQKFGWRESKGMDFKKALVVVAVSTALLVSESHLWKKRSTWSLAKLKMNRL